MLQSYLEVCKSAEIIVVHSAIVFGTILFCGRKLYLEFYTVVEDTRKERRRLRGE